MMPSAGVAAPRSVVVDALAGAMSMVAAAGVMVTVL
jgi:hypothetical protein